MNWLSESPKPLAAAARTGVEIAASTSTLRLPAEGGQLRRFSTLSLSGSRSSDGLVHDLAGYLRELAMLMLAHRT